MGPFSLQHRGEVPSALQRGCDESWDTADLPPRGATRRVTQPAPRCKDVLEDCQDVLLCVANLICYMYTACTHCNYLQSCSQLQLRGGGARDLLSPVSFSVYNQKSQVTSHNLTKSITI